MLLKSVTVLLLAGGALAQLGCKAPQTINADQGRITSPYYDFPQISTYPPNAKCQFRINVRNGQNVSIAFESPFHLEGTGSNCPYDYVQFYAGDRRPDEVCRFGPLTSNATRLAGPFCGQISPGTMVLPGSNIVAEFCTDSSQQYRGFAFNFTATSSPAVEPQTVAPPTAPPMTGPTVPPFTPGSCDQTIVMNSTMDVVYVQSPNYPNHYGNSISCRWTVIYPAGAIWQVHAEAFDTESNYDFLRLYNGNNTLGTPVATYSGTSGPQRVRGNGTTVLTLTFTTDGSGTRPGFRLRLNTARCSSEYSTCPNEPNGDECKFASWMMCDGKPDCPGGVDENYCNVGCGVSPTKPYLSSSDRIVYGIEARPHSWPWTVAMTTSNGALRCGGTIIDHHFVLTAAHCCGVNAAVTFVKVGEHNLKIDQEPYAKMYPLRRIINHPRYRANPVPAWDFCLLETQQPIMFSEDVLPVCLPSPMEPAVGTRCYIAGWGEQTPRNQTKVNFDFIEEQQPTKGEKQKRDSTRAISDVLRQIDVKIISQHQCQANYTNVHISDDMICMQNFGDSCQGDSGGPVVCPAWDDHNRWELHGAVSWAYGCADPKYPGANARVSKAIDWIADVMMEAKAARNIRSIL